MDTLTAIVLIIAIVVFSAIVLYALHRKGDVKAGANVGVHSFFLEVKEPKHSAPTTSDER